MRFGPVLTYRDIDEAKKLVGKKVVYSDNLKEIETKADILATIWGKPMTLTGINGGDSDFYPFLLEDNSSSQFIREVIEEESDPHYEPYDFSDSKVRDSMRGRWYRTKSGNEYQVTEFMAPNKFSDEWVFGGFCAATFLNSCTWLEDGTPCGQRVHAGAGHVEGNASERRIDG